jgi:dynactin complex subunit
MTDNKGLKGRINSLRGEHEALKERLTSMRGHRFLSPEEELEKRTLQKLKLLKKDALSALIGRNHGTA